ncbi:phage regulatory CII family protein [Pseudomonas chlororaphis subsp. aurantiaca]|uniref:phage regulatory CII family protein n=1 Tax=Pseudomonas chlororaphis TaxID=587753 RepID=UPI0027DCE6AE|nr:phage regulatory CII family protein [Pseudomonas chlororaphis]WMJ01376.1 phage regulatory CII family protein [Pseudomonas chlororaphis subsp. aurantiaca]
MSRNPKLPAAEPVLPLRKAIYRAAHSYKGGVTALALDMVIDYDTLQKKLKHDFENRWLDPDELEEVIRLTRSPVLLDALLRPAGMVWYKPEPAAPTKQALLAVSKLLHETGLFVSSMHEGAADNVWEPHEVAELEKHGADVIRAVLGIMAGAREAMEARDDG